MKSTPELFFLIEAYTGLSKLVKRSSRITINLMLMFTKTLLLAIALLGFLKSDRIDKTQKKQFVYILRYADEFKKQIRFGEKEQAIVREHLEYLKGLMNDGNCYFAGRTNNFFDSTLFGVIVFDATSLETAKETMNNDPMIKNAIMKGELHPFTVVLFKQ